ncbi:unnamed protein product [Amaranthus hypochondriacus]
MSAMRAILVRQPRTQHPSSHFHLFITSVTLHDILNIASQQQVYVLTLSSPFHLSSQHHHFKTAAFSVFIIATGHHLAIAAAEPTPQPTTAAESPTSNTNYITTAADPVHTS